jgi:[acyl-carrier-protein] S-malonyltransferase
MSKNAYVFPGQGSQFVGMGKDLYESNEVAKEMFERANEILGFRITDLMFAGTDEDLRQTNVTQPAIFLHSVIRAKLMGSDFNADMVAGHSLGEFSALVAAGVLDFEDGLKLVYQRAMAMQEACEIESGTMAAVLALADEKVEEICTQIDGIVVPANYNCPGQLVISGAYAAVEAACEAMKEAGAKRALILPVGGAFHSPLMEPAREKLATAIENTVFNVITFREILDEFDINEQDEIQFKYSISKLAIKCEDLFGIKDIVEVIFIYTLTMYGLDEDESYEDSYDRVQEDSFENTS